jgi:hypothetical membrane protein
VIRLAPARARILAGGVLWASTVQFFVAQGLTQASWKGSAPYSLRTSWISDLGATTCGSYSGGGGVLVCSPRHALLNGGLALLGVQVVLGTLLLQPILITEPHGRAAAALLVLAGAALPLVGAFPEDTGKPWHAVAATVHFAAAGLAMVASGLAVRRRHPGAGALSFVLGGLSLAGTVLTLAGSGAGLGRAGIERLAAWPFTLWTTIAGVLVLMAISRSRQPAIEHVPEPHL